MLYDDAVRQGLIKPKKKAEEKLQIDATIVQQRLELLGDVTYQDLMKALKDHSIPFKQPVNKEKLMKIITEETTDEQFIAVLHAVKPE